MRFNWFGKGKTTLVVALAASAVAFGATQFSPLLRDVPTADLLQEILVVSYGEYLIWAGGFFAVFWLVLHPLIKGRQLSRRRWPRMGQVWRELAFSLSTQFIFLGIAVWLAFAEGWGAANMYRDVGEYGYLYLGLVVFLVLVVDDTWFYWTHRAMHHPVLFERMHRVHHESVDPTPFTAFSFHPLEAVVHGIGSLSLLAVTMVMPWHPAALAAAGFASILFNVVGHLGYEVYPRGWNRIPVLRWKTPTLHHYMHHQRVGGNYGLYFRWWDKVCGTEFQDFEARYDRIFDATPAAGRPELADRL
jgi:sterol desaturase/sphingolipid hydroxylase (fatty acid hydroxylase superfamily)